MRVRVCVRARVRARVRVRTWITTIVLGGTDSMLWIESIFQAAMNIRSNFFSDTLFILDDQDAKRTISCICRDGALRNLSKRYQLFCAQVRIV